MTNNHHLDTLTLDATELKCPLLFVTAKLWLKKLSSNQTLRILLYEQTGARDIERYLQKQGFEFTLTAVEGSPIEFNIIGKVK